MNERLRECSRANVAQRVYNQLLAAVSQLGIPASSYELQFGQPAVRNPLDRHVTHICVRFIPAEADKSEERELIQFSSEDEFVRFFPGEGWELLEVFAYLIATNYPIGGLLSVGLGYTSKQTNQREDELWLGFTEPL